MRTRKPFWGSLAPVVVCMSVAISFVSCQGAVDPAANTKLRSRLGNTSMTVFPVVVRSGNDRQYDSTAADAISKAILTEKLATTQPSDAQVPVPAAWHMNESTMYRESAASFADFVKQHPMQSDYGLLAEYLIGGAGHVAGVHVYVVDKEGRLAGGYGLNSHQPAFREIDPKNVEDCTRLVVRTIGSELRPQR